MPQMNSFIRWAGGKSWLVPYVQELIQGLEFNNYYEPFMGGASVFFSIDISGESFLSDINSELVETFCAVRDNPHRIINYLKQFSTDMNSYYLIRETTPRGKYQRAARFLYLNTYSFNGIYRVNKFGKYNVPYGYRENVEIDYNRIIEASNKLQNAAIKCQDFDECKTMIKKGDLVFLDPPYTVSRNANTMFIKYNSKLLLMIGLE